MLINTIEEDTKLIKNLNLISNHLKIQYHNLDLLIGEQKSKKNSRNFYMYRLMEIESEIFVIKRKINSLLEEYFDILGSKDL